MIADFNQTKIMKPLLFLHVIMCEFQAIALSYKETPVELRELVFFEDGEEVSELLLKLKEAFDIEEGLVISTCNRTEVYYSSKRKVSKEIIKYISSIKGIDSKLLEHHFSELNSEEAINRLFRVSLGLESRVLGDIQIAGQVKKAYQLSADLNLAGPFLHRLMHTIFYANKRVVQETRLQDGTASVASVAVDIIDSFIPRMDMPKIALIGLGKIGQYVLENLRKKNIKLTLANRTRSKAEFLASRINASVSDFGALDSIVENHDVIVSTVASKTPIILPSHIQKEHTQKLFIDLSVPRSINPLLGSMPGISLYNVDQLEDRTIKAKMIREQAIPDAENIILESVESLKDWKNEMEVSPTIKKLKNALDSIRREELARHPKLEEKERELLELVTKNMMQKIIKLPVLELKAACRRGETETLVEVLNDLFNLEQQEVKKK